MVLLGSVGLAWLDSRLWVGPGLLYISPHSRANGYPGFDLFMVDGRSARDQAKSQRHI